jgi:phage shock protein C
MQALGCKRNNMDAGKNHRQQRLTRSDDRILAGVCAGIAAFLGWQPRATRALWCLASILTGLVPGVVAYMLLGFSMPPSQKRFNIDDFRAQ